MANISWWRIHFGEAEIERIAASIRNEHISQGKVTAAFESQIAEMLGVPYVVATTSGSTALLMALMAAGIGPGGEVIVPNRTWIATAHAPLILGAKTVLVDVEAHRPIIDVAQIEAKITPRTKAIMPVHLNGRSANMRAINQIADKHGLLVIEDAAQAFYSTNEDGFLGCQSHAGCFSLSVAKLIATGQGGFVVTRDRNVYDKLKAIRTHGVEDPVLATFTTLGFNFRFTDVLASIGIEQLNRLPNHIQHVKTIYAKYADAIDKMPFLKLIPVNLEAGEIPTYVEVLHTDRSRLVEYLAERNIQTRPFYPDLDTAEYFECKETFKNSRKFGQQGLFLPCGPAQPLENVDYVIDVLKRYGETI